MSLSVSGAVCECVCIYVFGNIFNQTDILDQFDDGIQFWTNSIYVYVGIDVVYQNGIYTKCLAKLFVPTKQSDGYVK